MDTAAIWSKFFHDWPAEMPRKGVAVTGFDEQIPFDGFVITEDLVCFQRRSPDSLGARQVIVPYQQILAVKVTEVVKPKAFTACGFQGTLAEK